MRVFLTGGSGLLGGYIAERLAAEGCALVALVRPNSPLAQLRTCGATLYLGDLRDPASLAHGMRGCDAVVHVASPKGGWKRPEAYAQHAIAGTHHLLAAMAVSGVRPLIHISTISVHGLDPLTATVDDDSPFGRSFLPYDHYGRAKVAVERLVESAQRAGAVEATVLRPGWIYGPGDRRNYGRLAARLRRGFLPCVGDGTNQIPLVYGPNVAGAVWHALACPAASYRTVLYASDGRITQCDLLASLARAAGVRPPTRQIPRAALLGLAAAQEQLSVWAGYRLPVLVTRYFLHLIGSNWRFAQRRLSDDLGYRPEVPLDEGLTRSETWYRAQAV